ncbi:hypothetical protein [Verrucosispora sp. NA02020]|uniref:hypothetical protein n=1 Tax=Verrucosispora sp. NA02020 TaxID=2742132 RepID=UPI001591B359|nr:hypothetical protein [Verrucosispora sp. NA02020]QKW15621.1 hypothetical protein HUT12_24505 [Verrucosispora sp. NA02020]
MGLAFYKPKHRKLENHLRFPELEFLENTRLESSMRTATTIATAGVAGLIVLSTALPAIAGDDSRTSIEEMLPVLAVQQSVQDRVPASVELDKLGNVSQESVRYLGRDDVANYWVGRAGTSQVCLILQISGGNEVSASTCTYVTDFYKKGLGLVAGGDGQTAEAYLLPADIDPTELGAESYDPRQKGRVVPGANLLTVRSKATSGWKGSEVRRSDGSSFRFSPIPSEGR